MDEPETLTLISELLRLLRAYESELTAYYQVFQHMERKTVAAGHPFTGWIGLQKILDDPRLLVESSALYANCTRFRDDPSLNNLEAALAEIANLVAQRSRNPSVDPDPMASKDAPVN
jgi:hypothetical protein